ncbi:glycosyl hydrolase [Kineococcus sp. LSe6-4]|uniref:Glycosyl hydrolase n=1 Tax=Kineococcus halophytocola TaxID=3234027 RepID=A0ABV4GZH1_9ACTN
MQENVRRRLNVLVAIVLVVVPVTVLGPRSAPAPGTVPASSAGSPGSAEPPAVQPVTTPKKGVAATGDAAVPDRLAALGVSWYYDWSDGGGGPDGAQYVPMVWGSAEAADPARIAALTTGAQQGRYDSLLGFNEPDKTDQSNVTPEQALQLWPALESTGLRLGSPAPADYRDGWLDTFMRGAADRGLRVDFIALHYYPDFTDPHAVDGLVTMVEDVWRTWHRPVWITEIGAIDVSAWGLGPLHTAPSDALADSFMQRAAQALESSAAVERYAWFVADSQDPSCRWTTLYGADGNLSVHGATYARLAPAGGEGAGRGPARSRRVLNPLVGTFRIVDGDTHLALHAAAEPYDGTGAATRVVTSPESWGGAEQQWSFFPAGDGHYWITSLGRGDAVLQATASTRPDAPQVHDVVLTPRSWDTDEQRWSITPTGGGGHLITNVAHGVVLSVGTDRYGASGASTAVAVPGAGGEQPRGWHLEPV